MPIPSTPVFTLPADTVVFLDDPIPWTQPIDTLVAGVATQTDSTPNTVDLSATEGTGGVGAYGHQWQKQTGGVGDFEDVPGETGLLAVGLDAAEDDVFRLEYMDRRGELVYSNELTVELAVLVYGEDTFTAANGTTLLGRSPSPTNVPGNTYIIPVGASTISSNRAMFSSNSTIVLWNSTVSDCAVEMLADPGGASSRMPRVNFRSDATAANRWFIDFSTTNGIRLFEVAAGAAVVRASDALFVVDVDAVYQVRVELVGTSIRVLIDGVEIVTYTSAGSQTNTYHGFGCSSDSGVTIDNFKVTAL